MPWRGVMLDWRVNWRVVLDCVSGLFVQKQIIGRTDVFFFVGGGQI